MEPRTPHLFTSFTDRARKVFVLAQKKSLEAGHAAVEMEHLLYGLFKEGAGVGGTTLKTFGLTLESLELLVMNMNLDRPNPEPENVSSETDPLGFRPVEPTENPRLPLSEEVKAVCVKARAEADALNVNYVGTEHVLLGMLSTSTDTPTPFFLRVGLSQNEIRRRVMGYLGLGEDGKIETTPEEICREIKELTLELRDKLQDCSEIQYKLFRLADKK